MPTVVLKARRAASDVSTVSRERRFASQPVQIKTERINLAAFLLFCSPTLFCCWFPPSLRNLSAQQQPNLSSSTAALLSYHTPTSAKHPLRCLFHTPSSPVCSSICLSCLLLLILVLLRYSGIFPQVIRGLNLLKKMKRKRKMKTGLTCRSKSSLAPCCG